MIKKEIELKPLNSFGTAKAYLNDNTLSVKVYGVSGCLKAWLTGKKNHELGNLVNGTITREIDFSSYDGILVTQNGMQMFFGKLPVLHSLPPSASNPAEAIYSFDDGFSWREISSKKYPSESLSVRYILSHKCFYNAFLLHGKYFYGTKGNTSAVAIQCDIKKEPHPFIHLSPYATLRDGYMIVCTDGKNFLNYEY